MSMFDSRNNPIQVRIKLSDTKSVTCPCGCEMFAEGMLLRRISPIISGGKADVVPVQLIVYCVKCYKPVTELLPPELRTDYIDVESEVKTDNINTNEN